VELLFIFLPVAALPAVDFPTIYVRGALTWGKPRNDGLRSRYNRLSAIRANRGHHGNDLQQSAWRSYITLQFEAGPRHQRRFRDVQAAINAAAGQLPANLQACPITGEFNPADSPIHGFAVYSDTIREAIYTNICDPFLAKNSRKSKAWAQVNISAVQSRPCE